jgi:putative oxidoreductase
MARIYRIGRCVSWPMVRFIAGANLVPHGLNKLFGFWGGSMEGTTQALASQGYEPAALLAWLIALTEAVGGTFIAIGFLTRPAAAAATIFLFVAAFVQHLPNGFWWNAGGYEYPMLWGVVTLAIFLRGGGLASVDSRLSKEL